MIPWYIRLAWKIAKKLKLRKLQHKITQYCIDVVLRK